MLLHMLSTFSVYFLSNWTEAFSYYLFVNVYLRWKMKKGFLIFGTINAAVYALVTTAGVYDKIPHNVSEILTFVTLLAYVFFCIWFIKERVWKRIFVFVVGYIIVTILSVIITNIELLLLGVYSGSKFVLITEFAPLILIPLIYVASLPGRKSKTRLGMFSVLVIFVTIITINLYTSLFGVSTSAENAMIQFGATASVDGVAEAFSSVATTIRLILSFFAVIVIFIVLIVTNFVVTQRVYRKDAEVNGAMLASQLRYYESVDKNNQAMKKLRHDYKNHLTVLALLLESGDMNKAKEYINDISDNLAAATPVSQTGNAIADAIISDKNQKANENGINLKIDGAFSYKNMKAIDICSILGNILDNAIEALSSKSAKEAKLSSRDIELTFAKTDNFFVISETNLSAKSLVLDGDKIVTSKVDKLFHGMGIGNIKESVSAYDGEVDINCVPSEKNDNEYVFTINIMIPFELQMNE